MTAEKQKQVFMSYAEWCEKIEENAAMHESKRRNKIFFFGFLFAFTIGAIFGILVR